VIRPAAGAHVAPAARVLASGPADVVATYVGGRNVYRVESPV